MVTTAAGAVDRWGSGGHRRKRAQQRRLGGGHRRNYNLNWWRGLCLERHNLVVEAETVAQALKNEHFGGANGARANITGQCMCI